MTAASGTPAKKSEQQLVLAAGNIIFSQGDAGGDLYIIDDGEVEIFQIENGKPIVLANMKKGEVIGIMTCLTAEPRMASARAKTDAVIRKIPSKNISSTMDKLPDWMLVVLKEFSSRLKNMNRLYTETRIQVEKLSKTQANSLYLSTQLAGATAAIGELIARHVEDEKIVYVDDLFVQLEIVLAHPKAQLESIWDIFCELGLIHVSIEIERKQKIIKMSNAKKLTYFIEFVRNFQRGKLKDLQKVKLAHKDIRTIIGLTKVAKHKNLDLSKDVRISVEELTELLPRVTNSKFDINSVELAQKMGLATISGAGNQAVVVFNPTNMGRTVGCMEAIRKITALDSVAKDADQSKSAA